MPSRATSECVQSKETDCRAGSASAKPAALVMAMLVALATVFALTAPFQTAYAADSSHTDFDTWSAAAEDIVKQLNQGEKDYRSGNAYQAGTDFQNAHWMGYDASNFSKVVNDTIGADRQSALLQEFTDLENLAYQQNNGEAISAKVAALSSDLTSTAQTLDANTGLAKPRDYAKQRDAQTARSSTPPRRTPPRARATAHGATWPRR